jgi:hypothetical protein
LMTGLSQFTGDDCAGEAGAHNTYMRNITHESTDYLIFYGSYF